MCTSTFTGSNNSAGEKTGALARGFLPALRVGFGKLTTGSFCFGGEPGKEKEPLPMLLFCGLAAGLVSPSLSISLCQPSFLRSPSFTSSGVFEMIYSGSGQLCATTEFPFVSSSPSPQTEGLLPCLFALTGCMPTSSSESLLSPFQMTQQMAGMNFCGANGMLSYGQSMSGGNGQAANQTLSPQMWK